MELNRLLTFVTLVETGSYTETANRLFVTQSAISQQIKLLQEELGKNLITKINNKMTLTPEGEAFYTKIKAPFNTIVKEVEKFKLDDYRPIVKIAGPYGFINNNVIPLLGTKEFQQFQFKISFHNSTQCNEKLLNGEIHLAVVSRPLSASIVKSSLVSCNQMALVTNKKYFQKHIQKQLDANTLDIDLVDMYENKGIFNSWYEKNFSLKERREDKIQTNLVASIANMQGMTQYIENIPCAGVISKAFMNNKMIEVYPHKKDDLNKLYLCTLKDKSNDIITTCQKYFMDSF